MGVAASHKREKLDSLQVLRGVAAAMVVAHHVTVYFGSAATAPGQFISVLGKYGVNVFFVLSGFIICFAHLHESGQLDRLGSYLKRRWIRLYPSYWAVSGVFIAAALAGLTQTDFPLSVGALLQDFALIDLSNMVHPPLKVGWTLFYEVQFYALFGLFFVGRRTGLVIMAVWVAAVLLLPLNPVYPKIQSSWNVYFFWGMLSYLWLIERRLALGGMAVMAALTLLALGGRALVWSNDETVLISSLHLVLAPLLALVVVGCVSLDRRKAPAYPRMAILLGDASYSLYLIHSPLIAVLLILAHRLFGFVPGPADVMAPAIIFALCLLASMAVYVRFERPLLGLLRQRLG